jgi:hypothetical protein
MLLDRVTKPRNKQAIKAVRRQIDEIVSRVNDYRFSMVSHSISFTQGIPGDELVFYMAIDIDPEGSEDRFEFWFTREPDGRFLNNNKNLFAMSLESSEPNDYWQISISKEQFLTPDLFDELLSWIFEEWKTVDLLFETEDDVEEFAAKFEIILPYRIYGSEYDIEPSPKSGGKKAAAAATATGFFVAYTEEEVSYADDDDSGFDFPEF